MKPFSSLLEDSLDSIKVNSNKEYIDTVNSNSNTVTDKIEKILEEEGIKPEAVAQMLAEGLSDVKSLIYYLILAKESNPPKLLEALSIVKDAEFQNKIKTKNKPAYFIGILRNWGIKVKFKKS